MKEPSQDSVPLPVPALDESIAPAPAPETSPIQATEATDVVHDSKISVEEPPADSPASGDNLIPINDTTAETPAAEQDVTVCQLRSASQYSIQIRVGGSVVDAVVDTAAEVTIISDRLYRSLRE